MKHGRRAPPVLSESVRQDSEIASIHCVTSELVASRTIGGGALSPYVGMGVMNEWDRFNVGVRFSDGSIDPNHPILEMTLTRPYGFLGASWAGPRRSALTGELFYAPGSLLTARFQASMLLRGS